METTEDVLNIIQNIEWWVPLSIATKIVPSAVSRNLLSSWEITGKVRADVPGRYVHLFLPDLVKCVEHFLNDERVPSLVERGEVPLECAKLSGREILTAGYTPTEGSREELRALRKVFLKWHDAPDEDRALRLRLDSLETQIETLTALMQVSPPRLRKLSSEEKLRLLFEADADLDKGKWKPSLAEKWLKFLGTISTTDLLGLNRMVQGKEDLPERISRMPSGVSILLELASKVHATLKADPASYFEGNKQVLLRKRAFTVKEELEAKVLAFTYVHRSLFYRSGKVPAGGVELERSLIDSLD